MILESQCSHRLRLSSLTLSHMLEDQPTDQHADRQIVMSWTLLFSITLPFSHCLSSSLHPTHPLLYCTDYPEPTHFKVLLTFHTPYVSLIRLIVPYVLSLSIQPHLQPYSWETLLYYIPMQKCAIALSGPDRAEDPAQGPPRITARCEQNS